MACCSKPPMKNNWNLKPIPIQVEEKVPSDIEIARSVKGKEISTLCKEIGVKNYDSYGKYKAKILDPIPNVTTSRGKYVIVTGITPTSMGEGKSTTTIGLVQALTAHLGRNSIACIRQPSQGPTFGLKGGAAGGGYSQVWPMEEFNLHLTGDIHAVTAANNLIAAAIDARMFHESTQNDDDLFRRLLDKPGNKIKTFNESQKRRLVKLGIPEDIKPSEMSAEQKRKFARLDIDPDTVTISRVIDTNDRFLRKITIGQAPTEKGKTRETKFTISVASELMAILALASNFEDVCSRVKRMVIGFTKVQSSQETPKPVTCDDLCISGAICALLKEAAYPNLIQTLEGTPVLVHCGPFANVAHGNSSIIADKLALEIVGSNGFVVTEAGFASDVGFEKFIDIKCRYSGLLPDCAILVVTVRALRAHGRDLLGKDATDSETLDKGFVNMRAHISNIKDNFNVPVIVAVNRFSDDTDTDLEIVKKAALEAGATECKVTNNWALGGKGAIDLASSVVDVCTNLGQATSGPTILYKDEQKLTIEQKIKLIASKVYKAAEVEIPDNVQKRIAMLEAHGFGNLPVCIAKTHLSISHDPKMKGAPSGYKFPIVHVEVSAGAGFVYALAGEISTMPGLPTRPSFFDISIDPVTGQIDGLF